MQASAEALSRFDEVWRLLTPDNQGRLLFLEAVDGVEPVTEREVRQVATMEEWAEQRRMGRINLEKGPP